MPFSAQVAFRILKAIGRSSLVFACAVATASSASDTLFYLAFNTRTHQCQIMVTKPDGETMKMRGGPYDSYDDAQETMQDTPECKPETSPRRF